MNGMTANTGEHTKPQKHITNQTNAQNQHPVFAREADRHTSAHHTTEKSAEHFLVSESGREYSNI